MAITDINISETLDVGAPSIKYRGNLNPSTPPWERDSYIDPADDVIDEEATIKVASDPSWEAEWEDAYQNYKAKQIALNQEIVDKETFMEDYQNNMATGGRAHLGLGSFIKKIGKAAKKVVGSPIGKAAILGGLGMYGMGAGPWASGGMWGNARGAGFLKGMGGKLFGLPGVDEFGGTTGLLKDWGLTKGFGSKMPSALGWGVGALTAGMGAQAFENMQPDDIEALKNSLSPTLAKKLE